ncbi:hypothetical protein HKX48_005692 [Thoreauomyces humboldtii]|nr:hypothetical protein HKX48_005692 [Thoreauomyces humboldtii]
MVSFVCESCQETLKKPKLEQHTYRCQYAQFSCIDCSKTFQGTEYRAHTSCISEAEKYQGALYKGPKKNGSVPATGTATTPTTAKLTKAQKKKAAAEAAAIAAAIPPKENLAQAPVSESLIDQIKKAEATKVSGEASSTDKRPREDDVEAEKSQTKKVKGTEDGPSAIASAIAKILKKTPALSVCELRSKVTHRILKKSSAVSTEAEVIALFNSSFDLAKLEMKDGSVTIQL